MEVIYPKSQFKDFYINLIARSVTSSVFRYDISSMTLSTDTENLGISEFEAKFDENIPKLFKEISFYKSNADLIKSKTGKDQQETLDIQSMHVKQDQVFDMIDYSNTQLSRSIEETSSLLTFIENQNTSTSELGHHLLYSLNRWLEDTQKQYEIMDKDVGHLVSEIEAFNFDALYEKTDELMNELNKKIEETSDDFKQFRSFSILIRRNIESLKAKRQQLIKFPKNLSALKRDKTLKKSNTFNNIMIILLLVLGIAIILALLSILYKLSVGQKREILG